MYAIYTFIGLILFGAFLGLITQRTEKTSY